MSEEYGYIRLSRKMANGADPFWSEKRVFSKAEAWIDLILRASFKDRQLLVGSALVVLRRGELLASERFLADEWGWSRGRVARYLRVLVQMERIELKPSHEAGQQGAIVKLVNYESYQASRATDEPPSEPPTSRRRTTDEPPTDHPRATDGPPTDQEEVMRSKGKEGKGREQGKEGKRLDAPQPPAAPLSPPLVSAPVAIWIPIKGPVPECPTRGPIQTGEHGMEFGITEAYVADLRESFPAVDIMQALREIRRWNVRNAQHRKTYPHKGRGGVLDHIENWLAREQNKARPAQERGASRPLPAGTTHDHLERARERDKRMGLA